ncbi:MAG: hypothetical protein JNN00_08015 [Chitinophagaceae bacterium]|nr:hypothetical protein [Chitinophagaceae bacterium]
MLRSVLFFTVLFFFASPATSQFAKGTRMAGASVASILANSGKTEQTVTSIGSTTGKVSGYEVAITPSFGWFITEKTVAGFTFNFNPSSEKITFEENGSVYQKDKSRKFNLAIGGFARNYFKGEGSFLPFGQFGFSAGMFDEKADGFFYGGSGANVYKRTYAGNSSGGFIVNTNLAAGFTKMVGKYTGFDIYAGYNFSYSKSKYNKNTFVDRGIDGSIDETEKTEYTSKYSNHRFLIGIGFQVFLEKGKKK